MPVSPDLAATLARETVAIYLDAEQRILEKVARRLARGIELDGWAERKALEVSELRREAQRVADGIAGPSDRAVASAMTAAYRRGAMTAAADLGARMTFGRTSEHAIAAIARATQERLVPGRLRIVRFATDVYAAVIHQTSAAVVVGVDSRREASARAMAHLTAKGVTGFVDSSGRGWDLASYTEMAVRTSAAHAAVQGHVDQLRAAGRDLVQVSNAPEECELCRPWEGKILALSSASLGEPVDEGVTVRWTLDQATAAGLFHPNCRHSVGAFTPGVTPPIYDTADPAGDRLRQQQRAYERRIRELKRRQVAQATDPAAARRTGAKLRAKQAEFKAWREANGRKNLSYRTSITRPTARPPATVTRLPQAPATSTLPAPGGIPHRLPARTPPVAAPTPIVELDPELAHYTDAELSTLLEDAAASDDPTAGEFIEQASRELDLRASTQRILVDADRDAEAWQLKGGAGKLAGRPSKALAAQARDEFDEHVYRAYLDAEAATNGNLVKRSALAEFNRRYGSVDILFSGRVDIAYKYASEELLRWWESNPRLTLAEFKVQMGMHDKTSVEAANRAAHARRDAAMRAEENYDPARAAERRKARARELRRKRS